MSISEYFWESPENLSNLRKCSYNCEFELFIENCLKHYIKLEAD